MSKLGNRLRGHADASYPRAGWVEGQHGRTHVRAVSPYLPARLRERVDRSPERG